MKVALFYHSLVSDWNHGNAHFLRGVVGELQARGCEVAVHEPVDGWSRANLVAEHGTGPIRAFHAAFPGQRSTPYELETLDLDAALDGADLVLVHEWNEPELVARVGAHRAVNGGYTLLFHDTHHRAVTAPEEMKRYDLRHYDGVLAFGRVIRDLYLRRGWAERAWVWHEAADTRVFRPAEETATEHGGAQGDVVWIGNWGDGERSRELRTFLIDPIHELGLRAHVHGVRYPARALKLLRAAGIEYGGWVPNHRVPQVFAGFRATVHVPRRPYVRALPGIPTIRVFEALACGIPLVSAPWRDCEGLFVPGRDFLVARDGEEMRRQLRAVIENQGLARHLAAQGLATIRAGHTCGHRVDELLRIHASLRPTPPRPAVHA